MTTLGKTMFSYIPLINKIEITKLMLEYITNLCEPRLNMNFDLPLKYPDGWTIRLYDETNFHSYYKPRIDEGLSCR